MKNKSTACLFWFAGVLFLLQPFLLEGSGISRFVFDALLASCWFIGGYRYWKKPD